MSSLSLISWLFGFLCKRTSSQLALLSSGGKMAEQPLSLTLEEIFHGGMKQVECTRTLVDGASGHDIPVTELLDVRITPGIREGTRSASSCRPGVIFCAAPGLHIALSLDPVAQDF